MEENKPARIIMKLLKINPDTIYWHKRQIQKQDAKIWDKVHIDCAKYRAAQLIQSLEECYYHNRRIMEDEKQETKDRMPASRTMCEAAANIF